MIAVSALDLPARQGTDYPAPHDAPCRNRIRRALGDVFGLSQFGVNMLDLPPGTWSSQRHWHEQQDEFVYVLEGEVVLVTDAGEEVLRPGDCAGFKAGDPDGHHLQNRSDRDEENACSDTHDRPFPGMALSLPWYGYPAGRTANRR